MKGNRFEERSLTAIQALMLASYSVEEAYKVPDEFVVPGDPSRSRRCAQHRKVPLALQYSHVLARNEFSCPSI